MMNTKIYFLTAGFCSALFTAQVGINTSAPTATLDVNGTARIRTSTPIPVSDPLDKIMIFDDAFNVRSVDVKRIFEESPRNSTIVKGVGGQGFSVLSLSLLGGWQKASFPLEEIDENGDFDLITQEFTAPHSGIYNAYFFMELASLLSASDLGIGIFKVSTATGTTELLSQKSFLNVSVLGINVSPPTRSTQTTVKLNQGDKIVFGVKVPLINSNLLSNSKANFSIWRMK